MAKQNPTNSNEIVRWFIIGGLVVVAFFGAYRFASASTGRASVAQPVVGASVPVAAQVPANAGAVDASASASTGCACCGGTSSQPAANGVTGPQTDGSAKLSGGVQAIAVNVTTVYSPNVIHLKAGVPAEITFSSAQGCTSQVQSQALGFAEDLSAGPKVVSIKDPKPGTYGFACGMNMVQGQIVVE